MLLRSKHNLSILLLLVATTILVPPSAQAAPRQKDTRQSAINECKKQREQAELFVYGDLLTLLGVRIVGANEKLCARTHLHYLLPADPFPNGVSFEDLVVRPNAIEDYYYCLTSNQGDELEVLDLDLKLTRRMLESIESSLGEIENEYTRCWFKAHQLLDSTSSDVDFLLGDEVVSPIYQPSY